MTRGIDQRRAPAIELAGLRESFGQVDAVKGLDLTVLAVRHARFGRTGAGLGRWTTP